LEGRPDGREDHAHPEGLEELAPTSVREARPVPVSAEDHECEECAEYKEAAVRGYERGPERGHRDECADRQREATREVAAREGTVHEDARPTGEERVRAREAIGGLVAQIVREDDDGVVGDAPGEREGYAEP
jgi:hypothetical protein